VITSNGRSPVEIEIESLSLHGFNGTDRYRIAAAIEDELGRIIERDGLPDPSGDREIDRLKPAAFRYRPESAPVVIGAQIARELFKSISNALKGTSHD
jgi:hypothetical protein